MSQPTKINYDKLRMDIINNLDHVPNLLLHSCCAPCSSYVITSLTPYFDITIIYYNPNIEPYEEYNKRKEEEIRLIKEIPHHHKLNILDCDYNPEVFHVLASGLEDIPEGGKRCFKCYAERLEYTAKKALELNYEYFGTTLSVSPYKNSLKINEIGEALASKYHVKFLYADFKKNNGYLKSIELSHQYNLYRQDYCGCIYSKAERLRKNNKSN